MHTYSVKASAPGKVILFGEHAVVHGVTAVAASLSDLRIFVDIVSLEDNDGPRLNVTFVDIKTASGEGTCGTIEYEFIRKVMGKITEPCKYTALEESVKTKLLESFPQYVSSVGQGLAVTTYLASTILPELIWDIDNTVLALRKLSFNISIESQGLPIGAGLGSSAAFSVALTGALYRLRQKIFPSSAYSIDRVSGDSTGVFAPEALELVAINNLAYAAEVLLHGNPSGLDNTTSCHGGFVRFTRKYIPEGSFENISVNSMPPLNILLTNTQVPRSTKALVAGVKTLLVALPTVVQPIFDSIEAISIRFLALIEELKNVDEAGQAALTSQIGDLFRVNHHLLNALGVGHPALTVVQEESHKLGMSCKLTGAGGGGCAITLIPNTSTAEELALLQKALTEKGFVTFQSSVGGKGLLWHE